jgi:hypothetical protein
MCAGNFVASRGGRPRRRPRHRHRHRLGVTAGRFGLLGDERVAGRDEAPSVVEDVAVHQGELLGAVRLQRAMPLVGGPGFALALE